MHLIIGIAAALLIFGVLVIVHEGGHFLTAKAVGVKVNEFSVGMGPLLLKKQRKETMYSVRLLPIGGFVALEGENSESEDSRAFGNKPAWARMLVLAAGPFMNFAFAVILLTGMVFFLNDGVSLAASFVHSVKNCLGLEMMIVDSLKNLITGAGSVNDLVGPVGIVNVVDQTAQVGIPNLLMLTVLLSLNLGLINILPFPALDGGRIVFVVIRAVTGKMISDKLEGAIHLAGIMILFGLMILITCKDVNSLIFG